AWFVDDIRLVDNANGEIDALGDFEPGSTAVVHREFENYVSGLDPMPGGDIRLTEYSPNELVYEVNTERDQFAVFSEIWYGPDKGWKSWIDGQPVEHIRVNYALRGMKVPAGRHTIRFSFEPAAYFAGERISFACSLLLLLGMVIVVVMHFQGRLKA